MVHLELEPGGQDPGSHGLPGAGWAVDEDVHAALRDLVAKPPFVHDAGAVSAEDQQLDQLLVLPFRKDELSRRIGRDYPCTQLAELVGDLGTAPGENLVIADPKPVGQQQALLDGGTCSIPDPDRGEPVHIGQAFGGQPFRNGTDRSKRIVPDLYSRAVLGLTQLEAHNVLVGLGLAQMERARAHQECEPAPATELPPDSVQPASMRSDGLGTETREDQGGAAQEGLANGEGEPLF